MALYRQAADGSGTAERLISPTGLTRAEHAHPDGKTISLIIGGSDSDIWTFVPGADPEPLVAQPNKQRFAAFSRDGGWLAYASRETGRFEVYVQPFPPGAKHQVSTNGGSRPLWSADGRELYFSADVQAGVTSKFMAVSVRTEPSFSFGAPAPIPTSNAILAGNRNYDITPDGKRFLVVGPEPSITDAPRPSQINVVLNWFEELKARVPTR